MNLDTNNYNELIWEAPILIIENINATEAGAFHSTHSDGIACRLS